MKALIGLAALAALCQVVASYNMTCFYDTSSIKRGGTANFTINDLQTSLQLCTHVVYGYVGIRPGTFDIMHLNNKQHQQFQLVSALKKKFRNVKFLLSVGGDRDKKEPSKYMQLLDGGTPVRKGFIKSAQDILKKYQFDGLDLAYEFPRNKARKSHSKLGSAVKKFKKFVSKGKAIDPKASARKQHFTQFVGDLKAALNSNKMMLSMTVLPNVNSSWYFNVPALMHYLDLVNLAAFDYIQPYRNPKVADYMAPLTAPPKHAMRSPKANIDSEVQYWIKEHADVRKLNLGVATYGRTWKITKILNSDKLPIVEGLDGPGPGEEKTHIPGVISWFELCQKLPKMTKAQDKKLGNYAYRPKDLKHSDGLMVTYDDPVSVTEKALYAINRSLGGMAIFDISLDDFRGQCNGNKFPIIQSIRSKML